MTSDDESALPGSEVHYLRSEHVGDEFKICVGHCLSPATAPTPVVYVGDPSIFFGTALDMVRLLNLYERLPTALVVGIGYRVTDNNRILELRCRDFTPTVDASDPADSAYPDMMGGAGAFSAFIRDELQPWVNERYDVDPDDSTFFGDSLGGLFAINVLLTEPTTFRRYAIGSPSLYWDNEVTFEHEAAYAATHDDLPAKVFVSVGGHETPAGHRHLLEQLPAELRDHGGAMDEVDAPADYVTHADRIVAQLRSRGYPSLEIESAVLPGEYHETAPPMNLSRSLRYLFDAPR